MAFYEFIKEKKKELGMNMTEFSALLGARKPIVEDWILGERRPRIDTEREIRALLNKLTAPTDY